MKRNSNKHPSLVWKKRTETRDFRNQDAKVRRMQQNNPFGHLSGFQNYSLSASVSASSTGSSYTPKRSKSTAFVHSPQLAQSGRRIVQQQFRREVKKKSTNIAWGAVSPASATNSTASFGISVSNNQVDE